MANTNKNTGATDLMADLLIVLVAVTMIMAIVLVAAQAALDASGVAFSLASQDRRWTLAYVIFGSFLGLGIKAILNKMRT